MKDMTQGNPVKRSAFIFRSDDFGQRVPADAIDAVDSIIVGQFVGADALAAVRRGIPRLCSWQCRC